MYLEEPALIVQPRVLGSAGESANAKTRKVCSSRAHFHGDNRAAVLCCDLSVRRWGVYIRTELHHNQSLVLLRDSQARRSCERARKSAQVCVELLRGSRPSRVLARLVSEQEEELLVVYN